VKASPKGSHFVIESERGDAFHDLFRRIFMAAGLYEHLLPAAEKDAVGKIINLLTLDWLLMPQQRPSNRDFCCRFDEECWAIFDYCAKLGLGDPPKDTKHLDADQE